MNIPRPTHAEATLFLGTEPGSIWAQPAYIAPNGEPTVAVVLGQLSIITDSRYVAQLREMAAALLEGAADVERIAMGQAAEKKAQEVTP